MPGVLIVCFVVFNCFSLGIALQVTEAANFIEVEFFFGFPAMLQAVDCECWQFSFYFLSFDAFEWMPSPRCYLASAVLLSILPFLSGQRQKGRP